MSFMNAETLSMMSTGMQAVGAVQSTMATYNAKTAEKQGYEFQSQIARNNAQIADWQAADAASRGVKEEQNHRLKTAQLKSAQMAHMAARGIDLGEGSALNILTDTDFMGERDALTLRDNAAKDVWGFNNQASNMRSNAGMLSARGKQINPFMAAGSTLLTGAGSVAASWYRMKEKTDTFGPVSAMVPGQYDTVNRQYG